MKDKRMKEIYHPHFPGAVVLIAIASCLLSLKLFSSWESSGLFVYQFFAILLLMVCVLCSKSLIEWKRIEIENGYIVIFKRFFKPIVIEISESLYQVVQKDKTICSFHFRYGKYYTQISPAIYINGDNLTKTITDHMKKHKIIVEVVT